MFHLPGCAIIMGPAPPPSTPTPPSLYALCIEGEQIIQTGGTHALRRNLPACRLSILLGLRRCLFSLCFCFFRRRRRRCCRDPITERDRSLQCSRLHAQICVIVFSFDKSQTPYSAGICVSSHFPRRSRSAQREFGSPPPPPPPRPPHLPPATPSRGEVLPSEISVCLCHPKVAPVKPRTWKMTDFDNAIYISV